METNENHSSNTRDTARFHNRVVRLWNMLPSIALAMSVTGFNNRLSSFAINI